MCGRYTLIKLAEVTDIFPWVRPYISQLIPRYNIAPSQPVAVVINDGNNQVDFYRWGLVPSWASDPAIGNRMINARAETLAQKPAFRAALRRRRCIVLADGFYEWKRVDSPKSKVPMYVRLKSGKPFAFAGLWESWHSPAGSELRTCTIITGEPNELLRPIHDRMAVILRTENIAPWLDPAEREAADLTGLLVPYPADEMEAYPVGRLVNSPSFEQLECIEPLSSEPLAQEPIQEPGLFD